MTKSKLAILALAALLAGCSHLIPTERTESAGVKASETISATHDLTVEAAVKTLAPTISTNGGSIRIYSKAAQVAGSTENISANSLLKIPFGVKLMLLAGGLGALTAVIWFIRRQYAAVDVAFRTADQGFARAIEKVRARAVAATDHREIALAQQEIAQLEAERGRIAAGR